jgi:hypothetical protein
LDARWQMRMPVSKIAPKENTHCPFACDPCYIVAVDSARHLLPASTFAIQETADHVRNHPNV